MAQFLLEVKSMLTIEWSLPSVATRGNWPLRTAQYVITTTTLYSAYGERGDADTQTTTQDAIAMQAAGSSAKSLTTTNTRRGDWPMRAQHIRGCLPNPMRRPSCTGACKYAQVSNRRCWSVRCELTKQISIVPLLCCLDTRWRQRDIWSSGQYGWGRVNKGSKFIIHFHSVCRGDLNRMRENDHW